MNHIDRIKKLLRLAKSGNQHEAKVAMAKAMAIAAEHQVDLSYIDPDASEGLMTHEFSRGWARLPIEAKLAALIVGEFFAAHPILVSREKDKIAFIGASSDVEIGIYVFNFLVGHFQRCWSKRPNRRLRNRRAFITGISDGLAWRLRSERRAGSAIQVNSNAIVASRSDYIARFFGPTSKSSVGAARRDGSAYESGVRVGINTRINDAVHSKKNTQSLVQ